MLQQHIRVSIHNTKGLDHTKHQPKKAWIDHNQETS